ncbi:MAG: hypothetical protein HF976_00450 [ANME-2 cluster archaeon]|nr:hypothetical protein [ANME-2 cluster archaeon]MBC2699887.1 hypothetical protein [ANME-2 cluster archaeon]MBC2707350.1 hypothetical protein [ANME-2 cluster archaeon]MBC2748688.1 hypothetical protein [ANME-2 cluster archaeon]
MNAKAKICDALLMLPGDFRLIRRYLGAKLEYMFGCVLQAQSCRKMTMNTALATRRVAGWQPTLHIHMAWVR